VTKRKDELAELARTARRQINRARQLGQSLDYRTEEKKKAHEGWIPDEDWRRDFQSVTTALQHGGQTLLRALEGNKEDLGGLTEEQLEAKFKDELKRMVSTMSDEEWDEMVAIRAKRNTR
jgi:hypothetical protein